MPDNCLSVQYALPLTTVYRWLMLSFIFFPLTLATGCGSAPIKPATSPAPGVVEFKLRQAARRWHHTPHRLGGLDRRGIDCSGLVKVLYDDLFHIDLPRSTRLQAQIGMAVASGQWTAGDLLFFKPENKGRHVGIYLANREFVHATTHRGVIVSDLSEPYWRNSYWKARRVLKRAPNEGVGRNGSN